MQAHLSSYATCRQIYLLWKDGKSTCKKRRFIVRALQKVPAQSPSATAAARRFFDKAMRDNGTPEKVTMDKSGSNKAAIDAINANRDHPIQVRQVKYLNNIVEQDHRAVKRVIKPMLNFKSFHSAKSILAGIELMHMIRKGQLNMAGAHKMSFADQFYALAGQVRSA